MAVPGAGLLALLRKRSEPEEPRLGVVATAAAASKFEARSSAVHALEHAVAAGTVAEAARPQAQGRRIPPGPRYTYDVDTHVPHEAQPQLPVTPVTLINTDYALHHWRQIAVGPSYICYGLKQGHIRVLSRHSAVRALLKGHTKPLTDLQFAAASPDAGHDSGSSSASSAFNEVLLASGGHDGQLFVWHLQLDEDNATIRETQQLHASFASAAGVSGDVLLSWHAPSRRVLAVGVGGKVLLVSVPADGGMEQLEFDLDDNSTPDATVLPDWSGEAVTCLAFSPDGQLLAAGGAAGSVLVWQLQSLSAAGPGGSSSLVATHSVAILAAADNGTAAGAAVGAVCWLPMPQGWALVTGNRNNAALQLWHSVSLEGSWKLLQTLQFEGKSGQQEFYSHVDVVPAQQLVVLADTARKAIYTLHYSGSGADLQFDYVARFGVAVPILSFTALWNPAGGEQGDSPLVELNCVQTTAVQQYSLDPALCYAAPDVSPEPQEHGVVRRSSLLERHGQDLSIKPQPSTAVPMPSEALASGTPRNSCVAAAGIAPPAAVAAAERAAEPVAADASEARAADAAPAPLLEPSIEGVVPLLASIPPLPPADAPESPQPRGASGGATPEECPSPPPTPTEQQRLADTAAAQAATAATAVMAPTPPRLLTPSDLLQSAGSSSATTSRNSASGSTDAGQWGGPAQPQPQHVLQRRIVNAAALPPPSAAREATGDEGQVALPPSPAPPATAVASTQDAAVAAAVLEQMGGVHKKFVGHVSLMYRELLKAMKAELGVQTAQQQQATAQLLAAAMEAQKQQIEAERAAVLAEERANIERLLTAISATLNQDLPSKLAEAVRGEVDGMVDGLAAALVPAVQTALATSLPKDLAGAVKSAGLDKALAPAVAAGLGKPLQEAFRTAFTKQLVPAFEGATQSMFQQINTTFTAGFEQHLQASNSALAASLQAQQQLLRAQSIGTNESRSPATTVDVRGELSSLLRAGEYEQAFSRALGLQDVSTVGWLASQTDAASVLGCDPCPLSQGILLSLVQQLSADLQSNLGVKLAWIREAALLINPADPMLARHLRPVLEGVYAALQAAAGRLQGAEANSCRLAMHAFNRLFNLV